MIQTHKHFPFDLTCCMVYCRCYHSPMNSRRCGITHHLRGNCHLQRESPWSHTHHLQAQHIVHERGSGLAQVVEEGKVRYLRQGEIRQLVSLAYGIYTTSGNGSGGVRE
jgi:hypothetical protein